MGGSVAMGADCERRSTTASEEASPKTASRIAERDMIREVRCREFAEIEGAKKRDGGPPYRETLTLTAGYNMPVTGHGFT